MKPALRRALARAAQDCDDASARAFFASPWNVVFALRGESLLAQHRGSFLSLSGDERRTLTTALERANALWFTTKWNNATVPRVSVYRFEVIAWLTARQVDSSETVVSDLLPCTIGFLFHDLIVHCAYEQRGNCLDMLFESPTFHHFFSDRERLWALSAAATSLGLQCSRDIVNLLVAHGARLNVDGPGEALMTPQLGNCVKYGAAALACLVENGKWTVGDQIALKDVVRSRFPAASDSVSALLRLGVNVNSPAYLHGTSLHEAAFRKDARAVRVLVVDGFADLEARDARGLTPLLRAARDNDVIDAVPNWTHQNVAAIEQLLALGADVDAQDHDGQTALLLAPLRLKYQVFYVLLTHGANPNIPDRQGHTPLHRVGSYYPFVVELTRLLLDKGADVNARTCEGETPLLTMTRLSLWDPIDKQLDAIALLLERGADPNIPDHAGVTPLQCCLQTGRSQTHKLIKLLENFGAK